MELTKELITVEDFIGFYEPIPEEKWIEGGYYAIDEETGDEYKCALGYLGIGCISTPIEKDLSIKNHTNLQKLGLTLWSIEDVHGVAEINDGHCLRYLQSTPKQRILAFLYDVKKKLDQEKTDKLISEIEEVEERKQPEIMVL